MVSSKSCLGHIHVQAHTLTHTFVVVSSFEAYLLIPLLLEYILHMASTCLVCSPFKNFEDNIYFTPNTADEVSKYHINPKDKRFQTC